MAGTAILAVVALGGCGSPAAPESPADDGTRGLPGLLDFLPTGAAGATGWEPVIAHPTTFDADAVYPSARLAADAYGATIEASFPAGPRRPTLELDAVTETDARAILVITERGAGDDSAFGSQHALVAVSGTEGWHVTSIWTRTVCRRGVDTPSNLCV